MGLAWTLSIYFVSWWLVLFMILPFGIRNHDEAGVDHVPGSERGAPYRPRLIRKFITTTWVTAIVVGALWLGFYFDLIHVPSLPES